MKNARTYFHIHKHVHVLPHLYEFNLINSDDPQQPFFSILVLKKLNLMALEFIGLGTVQKEGEGERKWRCCVNY